MRCGGVVLCGGKSRRMGAPKATLPFGPETMLQRVVRLLHSAVDPIVVVAAAGQPLPDLPSEVVIQRDQQAGRGPLEGLRAGLDALTAIADAAYVTGCDVPLLCPGFVAKMIALLGDHQVVVPREGDFLHPLAAVYRTNVLAHIDRLLEADRLRPAYLYNVVNTRRIAIGELRDADPNLGSLQNVNCPEEYRAALALAGLPAE